MKIATAKAHELDVSYRTVFGDVSKIIDVARSSAARSVNASMTAAYWLIGRRMVEFEQSGEERAEYGTALLGKTGGGPDRDGLDGASPVRTFRTCVCSTSRTRPARFARHCLANCQLGLEMEFARRRLAFRLPRVQPEFSRHRPENLETEFSRTVWNFRRRLRRSGVRRPTLGLPAAVVRLCAAAIGQERERPQVL